GGDGEGAGQSHRTTRGLAEGTRHRPTRDHGLDHGGEQEAKRERPEHLPEHEEGDLERLDDEHPYLLTSRSTASESSRTFSPPSPERIASATQCCVWSRRSTRATLSRADWTALTWVSTSMQ